MFITEVRSKGKRVSPTPRSSCASPFASALPSSPRPSPSSPTASPGPGRRPPRRRPTADSLAKLADTSDGLVAAPSGAKPGRALDHRPSGSAPGDQAGHRGHPRGRVSYWQVLARVLRPGPSLLAMVRLAADCAAAALLGWRRAFTEDDLYANGAWLEGRHAVIERRLWQARPVPPRTNSFSTM